MKVLVCGGRNYQDEITVWRWLDALNSIHPITLVIQGGAKGADTIAYHWATEHHVITVTYPANWQSNGKAAGIKRNQQMLDNEKPDLVIAFPGGAGTEDMMRRAHKAGITIWKPTEERYEEDNDAKRI